MSKRVEAWCLSSMSSTRVLGGETEDNMSCAVRWVVGQPTKSTELKTANGSAYKHMYLGQCGGIRCPNGHS
jgi:hypothetical protein